MVYITSTHIPLANTSHINKPAIRGVESIVFLLGGAQQIT